MGVGGKCREEHRFHRHVGFFDQTTQRPTLRFWHLDLDPARSRRSIDPLGHGPALRIGGRLEAAPERALIVIAGFLAFDDLQEEGCGAEQIRGRR